MALDIYRRQIDAPKASTDLKNLAIDAQVDSSTKRSK